MKIIVSNPETGFSTVYTSASIRKAARILCAGHGSLDTYYVESVEGGRTMLRATYRKPNGFLGTINSVL